MTINTAGYLESKVTSDMIHEVMEDKLKIEVLQNSVIYNPSMKGESGYIHFSYKDKVKSLFFCILENKKLFESEGCSCISLIRDEDSLKLISDIVREIGGYVEESDENNGNPSYLISLM